MTDKKEGPAKGAERGGEQGSAKRPFATIDLKATEVQPAKAPAAPAKATGQGEAASRVAAAAADVKARASAPAAAQPAAAEAAAAATKATSGGAGDSARPGASSKPQPSASTGASAVSGSPPPAARPAGGVGRMLSHLVAGLAGGVLAILGAQHLAPMLGLEPARPSASVVSGLAPDHAARLNVLEKQVRDRLAAPAPEATRSAALEQGLARIDELQRQVTGLGEVQTRITAENATLREELARARSLLDAGDRLARLEEQLAAMTAAAAADPQRAGRLPQLAQLTGQLADLKASIDNRLVAHRKDLLGEVERSTAQGIEAAETAKAGAQRLDREVTGLRSEAVKLAERIAELKAASDRLDQSLKGTQSDTAALKSALDGFRGDVTGQFKSTARPADVAMAVAPLADRVQKLESSVQSVVRAEDDRKSNAERIVLSLELGNLKRAMERGQKFAAEFAEVRKVAGSRIDLAALERFQNEGVPTTAELARSFRPVAGAILDADAQAPDSSVVDRLLTGAKTIVRVRKTTHDPADTSAEAIVARMETALKDVRLADVIAEARKLAPKASAPAQDWLKKVDARRTVDAALAEIDAQLKSSLGAGPAAPKGTKQ